MYKTLCQVSGGVTGTRCAFLKDANGKERWFATKEEAQTEADRLNGEMGGRLVSFQYWVV